MDWKRILIGNWSWWRPLASLGSIWALLSLFALFCADRLIFLPPAASYGPDVPGFLRLRTPAGEEIAAVHLPAAPGQPTLLYSHGNAEDLGHSRDLYAAWHASGLGVLAYDYPGYGRSGGRPTEAAAYRAAAAAWQHLRGSGVPAGKIVVVARSVGSGPGVWLAAHGRPAGLVLISPFTSAFRVAIPFPLLPGDRFKNLQRIRGIRTPLLVIHGGDDEVIPVAHGRKLVAASAAADKTFHGVPGAGHNDLFEVAGDEVIEMIAEFARRRAARP